MPKLGLVGRAGCPNPSRRITSKVGGWARWRVDVVLLRRSVPKMGVAMGVSVFFGVGTPPCVVV